MFEHPAFRPLIPDSPNGQLDLVRDGCAQSLFLPSPLALIRLKSIERQANEVSKVQLGHRSVFSQLLPQLIQRVISVFLWSAHFNN